MSIPNYAAVDTADAVPTKAYVDALSGGGSSVPFGSVGFRLSYEFLNGLTGLDLVGAVSSGTNAAIAGEQNHPGIVRATTGTTATGRAGASAAASSFRLGGGAIKVEAIVRVPTISTGAETFSAHIGLIDTVTAEAVDGVYFRADPTSGQWQGVCANNSVRSTSNLGAVVANAWVRLTATINAAGTSVSWQLNGAAAGAPVTTNIPTAVGRETSIGFAILKSLGTTLRQFDVDFLSIEQTFTTPR